MQQDPPGTDCTSLRTSQESFRLFAVSSETRQGWRSHSQRSLTAAGAHASITPGPPRLHLPSERNSTPSPPPVHSPAAKAGEQIICERQSDGSWRSPKALSAHQAPAKPGRRGTEAKLQVIPAARRLQYRYLINSNTVFLFQNQTRAASQRDLAASLRISVNLAAATRNSKQSHGTLSPLHGQLCSPLTKLKTPSETAAK